MAHRSLDEVLSPPPGEWEDIGLIHIPERTEALQHQADARHNQQTMSPSKPHSPLPQSPILGNGHPRTCTPSDHEIWHSEPYLGSITRHQLWCYMRTYVKHRLTPISTVPEPGPHEQRAIFWGSGVPDMSIDDYLSRLISYTHCSPSAFIVGLVYMDRIMQKSPQDAPLNELTLHRLMMSAITLAAVFLDDRIYSINHYARVGGVPSKQEMILLQITFLTYIEFDLHVTFTPYQSMLNQLMLLYSVDEAQNGAMLDVDGKEGSDVSDDGMEQ